MSCLECHLCSKNELVTLKEPSGGVHEDTGGDAINQVGNPDPHIISFGGSLNSHVEDNTEGFQRELVDRVDFVQVVENKVKD